MYISCWRYISVAGDISSRMIFTARCIPLGFGFFRMQIFRKWLSKRHMKKTYELNEYLRLDNLSHWKFRTKMMSTTSTLMSKQFWKKIILTKSNFWIQCQSLSLAGDRHCIFGYNVYLQQDIQ